MCDFASLTKKMFMALEVIRAGRYVYVIARTASEGKEGSIEDVIIDKISNPKLALERHCTSNGLALESRICLPVILPPGLKTEEVKGFKSVRTKKAIWIEYTGTI